MLSIIGRVGDIEGDRVARMVWDCSQRGRWQKGRAYLCMHTVH